MFRQPDADAVSRRNRRGVPRDLSQHLLRDIGLEPWPKRPVIIPCLW